MSRQRAFFFVVFFLSLLFCGCQANIEWFVRNLSDKEVVLTLRFETKPVPYRKPAFPLKTRFVDYRPEVLKINYDTYDQLTDSLPIKTVDSTTYRIVIPAHSTLCLSRIVPTDYNDSRNVVAVFEQEGALYSLNTTSVFEKRSALHTTGTLFLKNLAYFDYTGK